jgi:type 1 glutamine amidotransferase
MRSTPLPDMVRQSLYRPRAQRPNAIALGRLMGFCLIAIVMVAFPAVSRAEEPRFTLLIFSKTAGYRHASIPAGIDAIRRLGQTHGFSVQATESSELFNDETLARYQVVAFLNTTGDVLEPAQQAAFEHFIRRGGGFVGIHSATDTEYEWHWYGGLVGAYFKNHPAIQPATLQVSDARHPSTRRLPTVWARTDEWYNFREDPSSRVQVLIRLDETTYTGGTMGNHPAAWCHQYDGGRAWYTALGHTIESYSEPAFLSHLVGGIGWAAGVSLE